MTADTELARRPAPALSPDPAAAPWTLKVCGATGQAEIVDSARGGADHVGLWYGVDGVHELSRTTVIRLAATCRSSGVTPVLVTLSHDVSQLAAVIAETGIETVQLHAYQSPAMVAQLTAAAPQVTPVKVLHTSRHGCLEARWMGAYARSGVQRFLLDRVGDDRAVGSTGQPLDLDLAIEVADRSPVPVWLAGGLSCRTAQADVDRLRNHARITGIDVDSAARRAGRIAWPAVRQLATHWRAGRSAAHTQDRDGAAPGAIVLEETR
jgi:phosphoribosylanthranilate isomerase